MSPLPAIRRDSPQDSCPGAVQLHQAADGGLARVRIPGGILTATQWQALIEAAQQLGDAQLDLTSRGNLQLRGLAAGAEIALAARLQDAGLLPSLSHERVRNLVASPLTGRSRTSLLDVRPLVADFDRQLCARPALANLSGRFLFALDDGSADVLGLGADVALTAVSPNRLELVLAGTATGVQAPVADAVDLLLAAAEAFLAERAAQASLGWRVTELSDGPARLSARLSAATPDRLIPQPTLAEPPPATAQQQAACPLLPGPVDQSDGRTALIVGVPLGRLSAGQARALAAPQLVLTPWRSIVLPDLTAAEATELIAVCDRLGLITDALHPLLGVTACTGRPGCASALADVRADAVAVQLVAPAAQAGLHWAGCARRCGRPAGTVTDLVATGTGYSISTGDRTLETGPEPAAISAALLAKPTAMAAAR